jgi:hypothetical protein
VLVLSEFLSTATSKETPPPLPSDPKIIISTIGKNKLKNVEEGLLKIDLKLAFVIANNALR